MQRLCFDSKVIWVESGLGYLQEHLSLRSCPALLEQGGHNSQPSITWNEGKPFGLSEPLKKTTWTSPGPACLSSAQTVRLNDLFGKFSSTHRNPTHPTAPKSSKRLEHSSAFPLLLPTALEGGPEVSLWLEHSSWSC